MDPSPNIFFGDGLFSILPPPPSGGISAHLSIHLILQLSHILCLIQITKMKCEKACFLGAVSSENQDGAINLTFSNAVMHGPMQRHSMF
jgi:hypothetical protein